MELHFRLSEQHVDAITHRLQELSLAHKLIEDQKIDEITLVDGDQTVTGEEEILKHLDAVASELDQWYYCNC